MVALWAGWFTGPVSMSPDDRVALSRRVLGHLGSAYAPDAYCLTVVPGASVSAVLAGFGVDDPATARTAADDWSSPTVRVLEGDGYQLAVESNGWQGSRIEVLRRLSPTGRVASLFRNVNALTQLSLCDAGRALFAEEVLWQPDVDPDLAPYFADLDFDAEAVEGDEEETSGWWTSSLAVIERFTGVHLDGPPPSEAVPAYRIVPWLADRPLSSPPRESIDGDEVTRVPDHYLGTLAFGEEPFHLLVRELFAVGALRQRQVAAHATQEALGAVGLRDDPRLPATVASLSSDRPVLGEEVELMMRVCFVDTYDEETPREYNALKALEWALDPDPFSAAVGAVSRAGYEIATRDGAPADALRRQVLTLVGRDR